MRYEYMCDVHGRFISEHQMGKQPSTLPCHYCANDSKQVISAPEVIVPARWRYEKAGIREVTNGDSMNDIRFDAEKRKKWISE